MASKEYLAAKYMTGPKADAILARSTGDKPKKKKRKRTEDQDFASSGALRLQDDLAFGWTNEDPDKEEDESSPIVTTSRDAFIPAAKSTWATVHTGDTPPPEAGPPDEVEAPDELPVVVAAASPPRRGGLRTAAQLQAEAAATAAEEEAARVAAGRQEDEDEERRKAQETVYRDASGKKVDMKAERAEERRRKKERDEKEARKMEWGKGVVQRGEKEEMKRKLEEEKGRDVARYADDRQMNQELKEVSRWNDPAANFLTTKKAAAPSYPKYNGPSAPNRYSIAPGYRWDGVDRSTGFEAKWFQAINSRSRRTLDAYAWGAEDM